MQRKSCFVGKQWHYPWPKVEASSSRMVDMDNRQEMADNALDGMMAAMQIRHIGLFAASCGKKLAAGQSSDIRIYLEPVVAIGCAPLPVRVSIGGVLANLLFEDRRPVFRKDLASLLQKQKDGFNDVDWLDRLDMELLLPVFFRDNWVGLLALGPKCSGERYYEDDMQILSSLSCQAASALENVRLSREAEDQRREIDRLSAELRMAQQDFTRTDRAKSDFISIASHELRTPLTQVTGYVDMLDELLENAAPDLVTARKAVRGAKKAADRLVDFVSILLDVHQLDSGTFTLIVKPERIAPIITASVNRWRQAILDRHLHLQFSGLDGLPEVIIDGRRIKQVFDHLIQNAIKYTPDGGIISILGRVVDDQLPRELASIEVTVGDTGIGVKPEDLERIFDKFYRSRDVRLHSSGEVKFAGAGPGLGLPIARGIINGHGGKIWAESPGLDEKDCPGSTFHVMLPVQYPFSRGMKGHIS